MKIVQFVSASGLTKQQFRADFIAALVVTAIAIPESLGFAAIVGLPIQTGLYCALLAPVIFAILTSSKHLVVGADSATAALVASGAATVAVAGTHEYANAVAMLSILTGVVLIAMSAFRFGFLADLISKPVFLGFLAGIGIQLMIHNVPLMLGLTAEGSTLEILQSTIRNLTEFNLATVLFSAVVFAVVITANRRKLPGSLIALIAAILVAYATPLVNAGVAVVPGVPHGLPGFNLPTWNASDAWSLLPAALALAIVILAQSSSVIRGTAARFDEPVDDNRDLNALGFANIASAITHGFVVNGSPPRTTAAEMSGGRTQFVNIFMAGIIALILLFFSSALHYIPIAALAVIVFTIGMHLFNLEQLRTLLHARRSEFAIALSALLGVALLGVVYGVAIAVVVSLLDRLRRQYRPLDEILLRDAELAPWARSRIDPHHKHRSAPHGVIAYRFSGSIFFENSTFFSSRVLHVIRHAKEPVRYVIIDAGAISDIDFTAAETIKHLVQKLSTDDIQFCLAHVSPGLSAQIEQYNLVDIIGKHHIFPSLEAAIYAYPDSKRTTVEMVQRLKLPAQSYVVIGGGVLEALHLRETNDVDMVVSERLYRTYQRKGWREYIQDDGKRILSHHGYQMMLTYVGKSLKDLKPASFEIEDVRFMGVDDLITCKRKIGRLKDIEDVSLLNAFKKKNASRTS